MAERNERRRYTSKKTSSGTQTALIFGGVAVAFLVIFFIWRGQSRRYVPGENTTPTQENEQNLKSLPTGTGTGTATGTGLPGTMGPAVDAAAKASAEKSEPQFEPCPACKGTGECPKCKGTGKITKIVTDPKVGPKLGAIEVPEEFKKPQKVEEQCPECGGKKKCPFCGGTGKRTVKKTE